jgi:putative ABC transport system permease protein
MDGKRTGDGLPWGTSSESREQRRQKTDMAQDFVFHELFARPLNLFCLTFSLVVLAGSMAFVTVNPKLFVLVIKNLRRNLQRTILTAVAIMVLVLMVTGITTVLVGLDRYTEEKARDLKLIIMDRFQVPSQMPSSYAQYLDPRSPAFLLDRKDVGPDDFMTWSFYGGSLDPANRNFENLVFFFVTDPKSIISMMDDMENLDPALVTKLQQVKNGCLMGRERLQSMNRRVGERFKVTSINYKDIDLEFEVVGELPKGRYDKLGVMRTDYFNDAMDDYARKNKAPHPLDQKRLNLVWLRVPDRQAFDRAAGIIQSASVLQNPPVKCQTASSGIASFLEPYRSLLWGLKWMLVPALLAVMALVVANSISISVRERRTEMAVLKVLGFRPGQVAALVVGEALLVGGLSGLVAAVLTRAYLNGVYGGIPFPIGFISVFPVPLPSLLWGLTMGCGVGLLGCFVPALGAQSVKVSEVFAKVA